MKHNDIDALSGRELDAAVAVEFGWRWMQPRMAEGIALYTEDEIAGHDLIEPRTTERLEMWDEGVPPYSSNLAAAWELDGEGWLWLFDLCYHQPYRHGGDNPLYLDVMLDTGVGDNACIADVSVKIADFPTKAAAYATARCRVWLKAKKAEKLCEHEFAVSCPEGCN